MSTLRDEILDILQAGYYTNELVDALEELIIRKQAISSSAALNGMRSFYGIDKGMSPSEYANKIMEEHKKQIEQETQNYYNHLKKLFGK